MQDKFIIKLEANGIKYICTITSASDEKNTFFIVSYKINNDSSEARSFEIEMPDSDNENEYPSWSVRNKNKYSEEVFSDEFVYLVGQKINYHYDLMQYGFYSRQ